MRIVHSMINIIKMAKTANLTAQLGAKVKNEIDEFKKM